MEPRLGHAIWKKVLLASAANRSETAAVRLPRGSHRSCPEPVFLRRTRLVNSRLGAWPLVSGTGSWLEAHLVARLARPRASRTCAVVGSQSRRRGIWSSRSWSRATVVPHGGDCDSLAADQGQALTGGCSARTKRSKTMLVVQTINAHGRHLGGLSGPDHRACRELRHRRGDPRPAGVGGGRPMWTPASANGFTKRRRWS